MRSADPLHSVGGQRRLELDLLDVEVAQDARRTISSSISPCASHFEQGLPLCWSSSRRKGGLMASTASMLLSATPSSRLRKRPRREL
jgi:hypothetical protein